MRFLIQEIYIRFRPMKDGPAVHAWDFYYSDGTVESVIRRDKE